MLKQLLFSSRPAFLLPKTVRKSTRDPGVRDPDIRVWERCRPGYSWIPAEGVGMFICHVKDTFMPCFYILSGGKGHLSYEKCNVIFGLSSKKVYYVLVSIIEKMYLCKMQVNNSYFTGIDETEDYTTVETLER